MKQDGVRVTIPTQGGLIMVKSTLLTWAILSLLCYSTACSDDDKPPVQDAAAQPDMQASFLGPCAEDSDCVSGHCLDLGDTKRCSRTCNESNICPTLTGWSCNSQGFCSCQNTGKKADTCGVDGDCDGQPDKEATDEICNNKDDDCNGTIDDVQANAQGATQYYKDGDGDGFGDTYTSKWFCQDETGWVKTPDDCDDTEKLTYPGATEICNDAKDNNCDNQVDDAEVCGLRPLKVQNINGSETPGTLKVCSANPSSSSPYEITEIVAKQDANYLRFAVFLAGNPALADCASYTFHLGDATAGYDLVYIYRPTRSAACETLPESEAYLKGAPLTSTQTTMGFLAAAPGHISFTFPKTEIFPHLPFPTYHVKACTNAVADAEKDKTDCEIECSTPVRRD